MNGENKYVVVSSEFGFSSAIEFSNIILAHLQEKLSASTCYTYENIRRCYSTLNNEDERIERFLHDFDCGVSFQNIYWLFLLTPDIPQENENQSCDQELWLLAGKIIGQFCSKTTTYRNQISFWTQSLNKLPEEQRYILSGSLREYSSDFKIIYRYVDDAERRSEHLNSNYYTIPQQSCYAEYLLPILDNRVTISSFDYIINQNLRFKQTLLISKTHFTNFIEILPIINNDNEISVSRSISFITSYDTRERSGENDP